MDGLYDNIQITSASPLNTTENQIPNPAQIPRDLGHGIPIPAGFEFGGISTGLVTIEFTLEKEKKSLFLILFHISSLLVFQTRENEYLFIDIGVKKMKWFLPSHEVPFPATSDRRSRVAGNGTEWEVKTIELS